MQLKQALLAGVVLTVFGGSFIWALFFSERNPLENLLQEQKAQEKTPDLTFQSVTFSEVADGVKYWELTARRAKVNQFYQTTKLAEIEGYFFDEDKPVLKFHAPTAIWDMDGKKVRFSLVKGKTLTLNDATQLFSDQVLWQLEDKKIQAEKKVKIESGDVTFYGDKLTADVALKAMVLTGKPRAVIHP